MNKTRGFTLIELLVVIAIIGILASVVLASLNTARDKGSDAAIKSNLNNARAQAEIYYSNNNGSYASVCALQTSQYGILEFLNAARDHSDAADCDDNASQWAMEAQLSDGTYYCVDSTGAAIDGSSGATAPIGTEAFSCSE